MTFKLLKIFNFNFFIDFQLLGEKSWNQSKNREQNQECNHFKCISLRREISNFHSSFYMDNIGRYQSQECSKHKIMEWHPNNWACHVYQDIRYHWSKSQEEHIPEQIVPIILYLFMEFYKQFWKFLKDKVFPKSVRESIANSRSS